MPLLVALSLFLVGLVGAWLAKGWEVMATSAKVVKHVREGQNENVEGSFEALTEARLLGLF